MRGVAVVVIHLLVLVSPCLSSSEAEAPRMGIGISIGTEALWTGISSIYIPLTLSENFRMEPGIGLRWYSYSSDSYSDSEIVLYLNWGLFRLSHRESVNLYQGIRFGTVIEDDGDLLRAFFVAPALGGEYFLSKHFSVGGEAQAKFTGYSNHGTRRLISSEALVIIRWYF